MGPLSGYRIIEMAGIGPAPMCAMMLSDMGADVLGSIARPTPGWESRCGPSTTCSIAAGGRSRWT